MSLSLHSPACTLFVAAFATTLAAPRAFAQHGNPPQADSAHHKPARNDTTLPSMRHTSMASAPFGIPMQRMGSGTSWVPDATTIHASHSMLGAWDVMLHGVAFLQYDDQGTRRGDTQFGS